MRKVIREIFTSSIEELEDLQCTYNLEDCGLSGRYYGYHWYQDDDAGIAVYFRPEEDIWKSNVIWKLKRGFNPLFLKIIYKNYLHFPDYVL